MARFVRELWVASKMFDFSAANSRRLNLFEHSVKCGVEEGQKLEGRSRKKTFAWNISPSACAECLIPASTDTMQEGRIDDQFPKRIDQCHVERREAADAADVDPRDKIGNQSLSRD